FSGDGFLGICVDWNECPLYIVNVYAPSSSSGKRKLWQALLEFKLNNEKGEWCLGGDFNAVLKVGERKGSSSLYRQAERWEFNQFVEGMDVIDIPVTGKKFTWFSADGKTMSRLDRFLLSEGFIEKGGVTGQWIGDRDISDHCPIWLLCSKLDWGPKPFKFNNCWLDHAEFKPFVEKLWSNMKIEGKKAFILKEKLKRTKEELKKWNKEVFGVLDLNIDSTVKKLNDVESLIASDVAVAEIVDKGGIQKSFWDQLHHKKSLLKQKSRMRWVKEGDANSRFFHASIKSRCRRNQLVTIKKDKVWLQGVDCIKNEVKQHFEANFKEEWSNRPFLAGMDFKKLNADDNAILLEPFEEEEVREAIWNCDGNKSPGPDGFNFNFLKACWSIVKQDVMEFLKEFYHSSILPKAITASFLTLIPKKDHPQELSEYRPICLIGCLYKLLSKILAGRLKRVLGKVISGCQSAFLPSRQIMDGVVVLNENIDLAKRRKNECMIFKVDFERAYDTISWNYLESMMKKMGFAEKWLSWMKACVFESTMSVLINGSPTVDFKVNKGLRQGDPLSPFLFLIAAEGLTGMVYKAVDIGKFHGFKVHENLQYPILQFADDTVLIGEGSWVNVWTIKTILRGFELVSGMKINFVKSKLYGINTNDYLLEAAANFLLCRAETIPFKFLGLPVGANPRRLNTWKPVVESMKKRLSSWNGRHLSIGGRVTLINSVLSSLPLYFFSFFKAPKGVITDLIKLQRNFLWGGGMDAKKLCWVRWENICLPKDKGGLGVKDLEIFNQSLLSKWKWRCVVDTDAVWYNLLRFRYGNQFGG
ncbi:LINE-1 reverse transcriptase like, partial [Trifolium medium]|nr:LINE-1 reverse transcriptase like [Trifolium medium]